MERFMGRLTAAIVLVAILALGLLPGTEVQRSEDMDRQYVVFAAGPARDFSLAASERFILFSEPVDGVRMNSYTFEGYEAGGEWALQVAVQAIKVFNERIGRYEYTEFDIVPTPMQAGGVEYPGMTWINMSYYDLNETFFGMPASGMLESVVAHEVGHHWFYNVVGNSQVSEAWLDEALVQYITGLYYNDTYGESVYKNYTGSWQYRINKMEDATSPIGLPSDAYHGYNYVGTVYGRGPFFFEALHREIGDEAFNTFLREYFVRYHWDISTGQGLKETIESACKCDLTGYFENWVYP